MVDSIRHVVWIIITFKPRVFNLSLLFDKRLCRMWTQNGRTFSSLNRFVWEKSQQVVTRWMFFLPLPKSLRDKWDIFIISDSARSVRMRGKYVFFFFYIYTDNFWHYLVILTPRPKKKKNSRLDLKFLLLFYDVPSFWEFDSWGCRAFFFCPSARPFVGRSGAPSFMHLQVSIPKWSRLSRKNNFGQKKKLVDHKKEEEKIVSRSWRSIGASTSLTESFLFFTTAANEKHCRLLLAAG